jgi:putative peptidoglycan lipid II flippase
VSDHAPGRAAEVSSPRSVPALHIVWHMMRGAVAGKFLGFLREIATATVLGISALADAFRAAAVAVTVPVMMITNSVLPAVMIPEFRRWEESGRAPAILSSLLAVVFVASSLAAGVLFVWADAWVGMLVPGFEEDTRAQTVAFVRVMLLATPMFLVSTVVLCAEVALGRCRAGPLQQVFSNASVIFGLFLFALTGEPLLIGWCFAFAFVLLALYGVRHLHSLGMIELAGVRPGLGLRAIGQLGRRGGFLFLQPVIIGITLIVERVIASGLATGAVAALDYARAISATSVVLVGVPLGMAVLAQDYQAEPSKARAHFRRIAIFSFAFGVPGAVVLVLLAPEIVTVLLQRGVFQADATAVTATILVGFGFGFWGEVLQDLLVKMLNAQGRNNTAMLAVGAGFSVQIAFLFLAVPVLGLVGLGLATALRAGVTVIASALLLGHLRELAGLAVRFVPLGLIAAAVVRASAAITAAWLEVLVVGVSLTTITVLYTLVVSAEARALLRAWSAALRTRRAPATRPASTK